MSTSERPTRILRIITGLEQGGAEEALRKLLAHSHPDLVRSEVVSLRPGGVLRREIEALGIPVHDLGMAYVPTPFSLWRLRAIVGRFRPDVVEGWMTHGNLAAVLGQVLAPSSTMVWNVRSMPLTGKIAGPLTRGLLRLTKGMAPRADAIVYNSGNSALEHEAFGYPAGSRHVIPNGFDLDLYRPSRPRRLAARARFGISEETPVIGHVSRWHEHKDQRTLLGAFQWMARRRADAILVMIGEGLTPDNIELMSLVTGCGLVPDQVRLLGPMRALHDIYPMFDLFALSSTTEAFPNALGEAMSCGVPAIATDVGDCCQIIGDAGRLAEVGNAEQLGSLLLSTLSLPPERLGILARESRERMESRFSIAHTVARYQALYSSLR